jgi:2,3-dimethylmalate lyase
VLVCSKIITIGRRKEVLKDHIPGFHWSFTHQNYAINVIRTMRCFEDAGIAGLHIEDQVSPKKCGHMEGKQVVSSDEMVQKIKALVYARMDPDFLIIARTDARAVTGFDDAIRRGHAYAAAGADMLFIEAPQTIKELESIGKAFKVPVLFNAARTGKSPIITISQARDFGFKVMSYPIELLMACCFSMREMLSKLEENDGFEFGSDRMISFKDFNEFIGISQYRQLEQKFRKEASNSVFSG